MVGRAAEHRRRKTGLCVLAAAVAVDQRRRASQRQSDENCIVFQFKYVHALAKSSARIEMLYNGAMK